MIVPNDGRDFEFKLSFAQIKGYSVMCALVQLNSISNFP